MRPMMVLGGAGFVGHHLVPRLLEEGREVVVLDNLSRGSIERFGPHLGDPRLHVVRGDVTDAVLLRTVVADVRPAVVFHLAAIHFIPYCVAHPSEALVVNVVGTQLVLDALAAVPDARLVFASSADVYAPSAAPHAETDPIATSNVYGASKRFCEELFAIERAKDSARRILTARLFNVFGPGETNPHVLPDILESLRRGGTLRLGNLEPRRDYVHARDVADALARLATYAGPETVFNVGTGVGTSVRELVATLSEVLGRSLRVEQDPARVRPIERMHLVADAGRARRELGWTARMTLREGLRDLVQRELAAVA
ncbi:MAG TPA: GDP-mannose 4,6-dehydratase [Candidatus Eisenbacteria bacterium]|nr:GDP-mannose 4,6-dehydratase [Candidatus Eisenbacteria bacterium]